MGQWISTCEKKKNEAGSLPNTQILHMQINCIMAPNLKSHTVKLLKENKRVHLHDLGLGNGFF